jgi:hypothetical protein
MAVGIVMAVISITVVLVLLTRMESKNKELASADLAGERVTSKPGGMLELVYEEVREAGIGSLPGAEGVDPTVLLRVWKRDSGGCAQGQGAFVLTDGVPPNEATIDTLSFECVSTPKSGTADESVTTD